MSIDPVLKILTALEPLSQYRPSLGWFGIVKSLSRPPAGPTANLCWTGCREVFHDYWNALQADLLGDDAAAPIAQRYWEKSGQPEGRSEEFWRRGQTQYHGHAVFAPAAIWRLNWFLGQAESVLGLEGRSVLQRVADRPEWVWITPDPFWRESKIRLNFYSGCIRAALELNCGFFESLYRYKYFSGTFTAVVRFLDGNTRYTGSDILSGARGWASVFHGLNSAQVEPLLVRG